MANRSFALRNRGSALEKMAENLCAEADHSRIAFIQRIETPIGLIRDGDKLEAFHKRKSTLDFRGVLAGGRAISFDCKESSNTRGLPLKYIKPHQVEYIRRALHYGEYAFILALVNQQMYHIPGVLVVLAWDCWQEHKGKRGYWLIPVSDMIPVRGAFGMIAPAFNDRHNSKAAETEE